MPYDVCKESTKQTLPPMPNDVLSTLHLQYADKNGKNKLPVCYEGDFELPEGNGERLIVVHFSKQHIKPYLAKSTVFL